MDGQRRRRLYGKPRPVVILPDDRFDGIDYGLHFHHRFDECPTISAPVEPGEQNGLKTVSWLMVDKITTVSKTQIGTRLGRIGDADLLRLNRVVLVFLGLAGKRVALTVEICDPEMLDGGKRTPFRSGVRKATSPTRA